MDDTPNSVGGKRLIVTHEGYVIPLRIRDGLARMDMRKPNEDDFARF